MEKIKTATSNTAVDNKKCLVLCNDDINTFNFVVESLIEVCQHNNVQATQCALIAHHNGQCEIYNDTIKKLTLIKNELSVRGLTVVIK